ncbi:MAG: leucine-rich repeat protein [Bacteroidales bacterium]|nr:leucine-rich repeat protein [Bacteroidales bacterium]
MRVFSKWFSSKKTESPTSVEPKKPQLSAADYCERGQKSLDAGKYVEAMEYFQAAIEADKRFEKAYFLLATAYEKQGKADKAKAALYALLAVNPNNERAFRVVQGIISLEEIRLPDTQQTAIHNQSLSNTTSSSSTCPNNLFSHIVPIGHKSGSTDFDFYVDCGSNRLYMKIVGLNAEVVAPNGKKNNVFYHRWDGYKKPEGDLTIPSVVAFHGQQYDVSSIGEEAFKQCDSLQNIVIQNPVSIIKSRAFENCSRLCSVTLPDSLITIGISAFASCALVSIRIPTKVNIIHSEAFKSCKINHLVIPDCMDSIDASIVSNCYSLKSITIPASVTRLTGNWCGIFRNDEFIMIMEGHPPVVDSMAEGIKVEVPDNLLEEYRNVKYWQRCDLTMKSQRAVTKRENGKMTFKMAKICWLLLAITMLILSIAFPFSKASFDLEDVWLLLMLIGGVDSVVIYYITYKILYLVVYRRDNLEGDKFGKGKYNPVVYNLVRNIAYIAFLLLGIITLIYLGLKYI